MSMTNKSRAKEAVESLTSFANSASIREFQEFAQILTTREHRTLQQSAFRIMVECIQAWAKAHDTMQYDLRNEATVQTSKELWDNYLNDKGFPLI